VSTTIPSIILPGILLIFGQWSYADTTLDDLLLNNDPLITIPTKELAQIVKQLEPLENQARPQQRLIINLFKMRHLAITGDFDKALELLKEFDDPSIHPNLRVRAYTIALPVFHITGKYVQAFNTLHKIQQLLPWVTKKSLRYIAISPASELYVASGDLNKALSYSFQAIEAAKKTGDVINLCSAYDNLSGTYYKRNEFEKSARAYRKMLAYCDAKPAPLFSGMAHNGLGIVLQKQNRHKEALAHFQTAYKLCKETNYQFGISFSLLHQAQSQLALGNRPLANEYIDKALHDFETFGLWDNLVDVYELKSELSALQGNYKEALHWFKKRWMAEKKTIDSRKAIRIAQLTVEFEVRNKEQHIEQLTSENQLLALQKKSNRQQSLIIILALVVIILVTILFWIKAQRERGKFKHMSQVDPLTQLYNHAYSYSIAEIHFRKCISKGQPFTVVVADIDWFKFVNDTYGHAAGDKVLQAIANVLRICFTKNAVVGRTGGEEFTCFLPNMNARQARELVQNCREAVHPVVDYGKSIEVTLSYGIAESHGNYHAMDTLVRDADDALYKAKRNGRNQIRIFHPQKKTSTHE
jgi:diguanylate cyclase (GGDEF)-like protein